MERKFECIDEQTNINSLSIELYCKRMVANYKRTAQLLDALLEDSKGAVIPTLGGKILINTGDDKRLAVAIVQEVKHYFGEPKNKPKNTSDEVLIINMADDWLEGVKRSSAKTTRQEYVNYVVERTKREYAPDTDRANRGDTATTFNEIIKAVEQWAKTKPGQPKTKKTELKQSKPSNSHDRFCSKLDEDNARTLFQALYSKNYISGEVPDWLIYCGAKDGTPTKRMDWLQGLNELAYFVAGLFGTTNKNDLWSVTVNVFSIKGSDINKNSIRSLHNQCKISKTKRAALDEILRKAKKDNIVNELRNN